MNNNLASQIPADPLQTDVTIHVGRCHIARMEPALECVQRLLTVTQRTFTCDGPLGYQEHVQRVGLSELENDSLYFSAGFVRRVVADLKSAGYRVRVNQERLPWLIADWNPPFATPRDQERIEAVRRHGLGRIEVVDERDAFDVCWQIAEAFAAARILVVLPNLDLAKKMTNQLRLLLREPIRLFFANAGFFGNTRCSVATVHSLPEKRYDVILLPMLADCLGEVARGRLAKSHFLAKRIFGCTVAGKHYDEEQRLRFEQISGPIRCRIAKPRVPLFFSMVPTPPCHVRRTTTYRGRQRTCFDCNDLRNRLAAGIALTVAGNPLRTCRELFDTVPADLPDPERLRVAVLAESAMQARRLALYLPEWRLCVAHSRALLGRGENGSSRHSIVTSRYAARSGVAADILIRATGTRSPLHVRNFPARVAEEDSPRCALLLDFDDQFNRWSSAQSRRRRRQYAQSGATELSMRTVDVSQWLLPEVEVINLWPGRGS
ncbi:MAG: hypothetical protein C0483_07585 [Pirellula sp.]|nr:hypothetical protein [Pirellula sp.]